MQLLFHDQTSKVCLMKKKWTQDFFIATRLARLVMNHLDKGIEQMQPFIVMYSHYYFFLSF